MSIKSSHLAWIALAVVACGGGTPPPAAPPPTPAPPAASSAAVAEEPEPVEEPDAGTEDAAPPEEEQAPPPRRHGPIAMFNDPPQPVTIGYDGAEFTLSCGAILDIPADALHSPRNIWFAVDKKARFRKLKGKLGELFIIEAQIPGQKYIMGKSRPSHPVATSGEPFVIKLPLPKGVDKANLAVESVEADGKGRPKSTWTVIAMTKLETSDDGNRAVFEVRQLPDAHVYLTSEEPSSQ